MLFLIPLQDLVVFVSVFHVSLPTQLQSLSFGFGVALFPLPVLNMLTFWDLPWCCNLPSPFSSNSVSADAHFTSKAGLYFSKFCFCFFDDIAKNFSWAQLYICVWNAYCGFAYSDTYDVSWHWPLHMWNIKTFDVQQILWRNFQ